MEFEYDPAKSASNLSKHGIDFEEAKKLWQDERLFEVRLGYEGEPRFAAIGKIDSKLWTAIITYRGEAVGIISVRRSREKEAHIYEES